MMSMVKAAATMNKMTEAVRVVPRILKSGGTLVTLQPKIDKHVAQTGQSDGHNDSSSQLSNPWSKSDSAKEQLQLLSTETTLSSQDKAKSQTQRLE